MCSSYTQSTQPIDMSNTTVNSIFPVARVVSNTVTDVRVTVAPVFSIPAPKGRKKVKPPHGWYQRFAKRK